MRAAYAEQAAQEASANEQGDGTGSDAYFLQGKNGFGDHFPDAEFTTAAFQAAYPIADTAYDPAAAQPCAHVWDAGTEVTPATCTEDGEALFTCTLCGATKTEPIPAAGHSYGAPTYEWGEGYLTCTAKAVYLERSPSKTKVGRAVRTR